MAKSSYKIPYRIGVTQMDVPLALRKGDLGLKRPVSLRAALYGGGGFILWFSLIIQVLTKWHWGVLSPILITIGWFSLLGLAVFPQKTGELGYKWFIPTMAYWFDYKLRFLNTRSDAGKDDIMKLKAKIPLSSIDENGVIHFDDGRVGIAYDIIGMGSLTLFGDERDQILDRVDNWLRSVEPGTQIIQLSGRAPQKVTEQIANIERLKTMGEGRLTIAEKDLLSRREKVLNDFVGINFKSVHQWLLLITDDLDKLQGQQSWFENQAAAGMLSDYELLKGPRLFNVFRMMFQ